MFNYDTIKQIVREKGFMPDEDHFDLAEAIVDLCIELGSVDQIKKYFYKN